MDFESTAKAYKSHQHSSLQEVLLSHKGYFIQKYWNVPRYGGYLFCRRIYGSERNLLQEEAPEKHTSACTSYLCKKNPVRLHIQEVLKHPQQRLIDLV